MSDIVSLIKSACPPDNHDLGTAEGRKAWDDALRAELAKVECYHLRSHASNFVKEWRYQVYLGAKPREIAEMGARTLFELERRISALEVLAGLAGRS
jgi:hypothetical protein